MSHWTRVGMFGLGALLVLGGMGCRTRAPTVREVPKEQALCFSEGSAGVGTLSANRWKPEVLLGLLLNGYDPSTGQVATPHADCMGTPVLWQDPQPGECAETETVSTPLTAKRLTAEDVVVSDIRLDFRIVWAVVRRYSDGDGMGPVAVVESTPRGLAVRALGMLRAWPQNAKLRLERVGGVELLVAEGERCGGPNGASCQRAVRVMPMRGNRFINEPLHTADGACASPAFLYLNRSASRSLPGRWLRRYDYTAQLDFTEDGIQVQEQMVVNDSDRKQSNMPGRPFRKAQLERRIRLASGKLVVDEGSLWGRLLEGGAAESSP